MPTLFAACYGVSDQLMLFSQEKTDLRSYMVTGKWYTLVAFLSHNESDHIRGTS